MDIHVIGAQLGISALHLALLLLIAALAARKYKWARKPALALYVVSAAAWRLDLAIIGGLVVVSGFLFIGFVKDLFANSRTKFSLAVAIGSLAGGISYFIIFH